MSKLIELTIDAPGDQRKYTGRFLGFITDDEFNALVQRDDKSRELAHKIESKETKPLTSVCSALDDVTDYRLVMTIKKINDVNVQGKKLFISEKLNYISNVGGETATIIASSGECIEIEEN